ncbi:phytoene desaturase family protein [Pseudalkalibacillus caeni]|uniref:4,4'-diaponeurosporene oxygenase n=1 Tax=Exobacillus caeni TaxID=2574798 RepID=A0A5R9F8N2_9BACL|nr:phytoene desaturase family protein [Pseudalkalibacillus caeni]TLS36075.1 phytoene desaturase [Pseudalkalibacillus caeni]
MKKVIVIGGGLGGLSAAATLARNGFDVKLFEKNEHLGGKLMPVKLGTHHFDFGPNTITMPHVFDSVFHESGENPRDYFEWVSIENHTQNVGPDGEKFLMSTDPETVIEQLNSIDPYAAKHYPAFLEEVKRLYHLSEKAFFHRTFTSWKDYFSPGLFSALQKVKPLETMDHFHQRYFKNPFLLQVFNRYATYIGSSPYVSPATFSLIAYLEMVQGVFYVKGGTVKIAEGLAELARKNGADLLANTEVSRILTEGKRAVGVELSSGEKIEADTVVLNGDLLEAMPSLLDEKNRSHLSNRKIENSSPSISAFVILAGLDRHLDDLIHHQVYFSADYKKEFRELFGGEWPDDPTIYISNSSYTDKSVSPDGSNLFILVNAPPLAANGKMSIDPEVYKEQIYNRLRKFGITIKPHLKHEKVFTPIDINRKFRAFRGALYGLSSNRKKDSFLRPFNRSQDIQNLYFAGGTTHPGGGSPMVVISGQNVAREIISAFDS